MHIMHTMHCMDYNVTKLKSFKIIDDKFTFPVYQVS